MKKLILITTIIILIISFIILFFLLDDKSSKNIQTDLDSGSINIEFGDIKNEINTIIELDEDGFLSTKLFINENKVDTYEQMGRSRAYISEIFSHKVLGKDYIFVIVYWDMSDPYVEETFNNSIWNVFAYNNDFLLDNSVSDLFPEKFSDVSESDFKPYDQKTIIKFFSENTIKPE